MIIEGVLAVLPLLLMIGLGVWCAGKPWFGRQGMNFLSKFTINIAIPIYLFNTVVRMYTHPSQLLYLVTNMRYFLALIICGMTLAYTLSRLLGVNPPQRGVFVNAVTLSNTVVMGMPVVASLYGDESVGYVMICYASNTLCYWTLGVWFLRREGSDRKRLGVWATLREVFSARPLLGFLAGIACIALSVPIPAVLMKTFSYISGGVTLMTMLFVGCVIRFADFSSLRKFRELWIILGYRYLLVPLLTGFGCWLLPLPSLMKHVFFLVLNMPAMAQLPIMAKEVGSDYELASMATAVTTAVSMAAVPVYVTLMAYTGIFA